MIHRVNRLAQGLLRKRYAAVAAFQAVLIICSLLTAWLLRFDFQFPYRKILFVSIPVLVVIRLLAISAFNLMHGWWRYTGVNDAIDVIKAVSVGSVVFFLVVRYGIGIKEFPLSVYPIEALVTAFLLCGVRISSRIVAESVLVDSDSTRLVIIGAGSAAQMLIREIKQPNSGYAAIGCLDDDPSKRNLKIQGVPVLGPVESLSRIVAEYGVDEVLIALPSATGAQMKRFVDICEQAGVHFRTAPSLKDLISGELTISQLREVNVEDLLGREAVRIDLDSVNRAIQGKVVMVTGAAGSIGSELCRQILRYGPEKLICVDHNETGIFYLERDLSTRLHASRVQYAVADIRNTARITKLLWESRVQVVFHAAAYKHVPVMEANVPEAVENNVFALMQLLNIAEDAGCHAFVLISSDKAVKPTSVMGATKRLGELIMAAWPSSNMRCLSVRFGNVLGSSGSVIPVFKEQLKNGGAITITHPDIERFFMTISEAVALVLQGYVIGKHRDILVLDMGEPIRIVDLAETLVRLSGKLKEEVVFKFTGLRPGEKLYEELFYDDETIHETSCNKIKRTQGTVWEWDALKRHMDELESTLFIDGARPIRKKIGEIIPEYTEKSGSLATASVPLRAAATGTGANV